MANEVQITARLVINDGVNYKVSIMPGTVQADLASKIASAGVFSIGTAAEFVSMGDVSTAGHSFFRNLSATSGEYVDIGGGTTSSFTPVIRLYPGEVSLCPLATTTIVARASTSQTNAVNVQQHVQSR